MVRCQLAFSSSDWPQSPEPPEPPCFTNIKGRVETNHVAKLHYPDSDTAEFQVIIYSEAESAESYVADVIKYKNGTYDVSTQGGTLTRDLRGVFTILHHQGIISFI